MESANELTPNESETPGPVAADLGYIWYSRKFSGFMYGAAGVPELLHLLYHEFFEVGNAVHTLLTTLATDEGRIDLLTELIKTVPDEVQQTQRLENPYAAGTDKHTAFRFSWYTGYIGFSLVSMIYGGPVLKAIENGVDFASDIDRVANNLDRLDSLLERANDMSRTARLGSELGSVAIRHVGEVGGEVIPHLPSAAQQVQLVELIQLLEQGTLESLSEFDRQLADFVLRTGTSGVELLNEMDDQSAAQLLDEPAEDATEEVLVPDGGEVELHGRYESALDEAENHDHTTVSDVEQTIERVEQLDGERHEQAKRFIVDAGPESVAAVGELESHAEFERLLEITYDGAIDGDERFVDDELTAQDTLRVTKEIPINKIIVISKDNKGVRWLGKGDNSKGMSHIEERYIYGESIRENSNTTFFPTGKSIEIDDSRLESSEIILEDKMNIDDIKQMIYTAISKQDPTQEDEMRIVYTPDTEYIDKVWVIIVPATGEVITAYPVEGEAVDGYDPQEGEWISP